MPVPGVIGFSGEGEPLCGESPCKAKCSGLLLSNNGGMSPG